MGGAEVLCVFYQAPDAVPSAGGTLMNEMDTVQVRVHIKKCHPRLPKESGPGFPSGDSGKSLQGLQNEE